jgi:hypothetical protein
LGWRALGRSPTDYTAFVHLIDASGKIVAQQDQPPGGPANPTSLWVPGESVRSSAVIQLPANGDLKDLKLRMGLYEPVSGNQLSVRLATGKTAGIEEHGTFLILPAGN